MNKRISTPTKLALLALLLYTGVLMAQGTEPPAPDGPPNGLPIDGLVWFGGIVALAYGAIKKLKNPKE